MASGHGPQFPLVCCFFMIFTAVLASPADAIDLTSAEREYLNSRNTIVFVSQTRYPPFEFVRENGQHEGMMLDVVRWMAVEMGFHPVFLNMTFQQAQDAVLSGRADIITSLFHSVKREENFEFTETILDVPASIFVRAERTDIKDLNDLNGKTIAMQRGDFARDFLVSRNVRFDILDTEDFSEALNKVVAGNADAVIGDEQTVLYHIFSGRLTSYLKKVGVPLYIGKNSMASNKANAMLVRILNKGIIEARKSGVLDKVNTKWMGKGYAPRQPLTERFWPLSAVAVGILLIAAGVWTWNVRLRALVQKKTEVASRSGKALRESEAALSRKNAELLVTAQRLEHSMNMLQLIIESIPVRVFWKDRDLRFLGCNTHFARDAGLSHPWQLLGQDDFAMGWKEQAERYRSDDFGVIESGVPKMNIVEPQTTPSGSTIWLNTSKVPLRLPNGEVLGILGVYEDITERRQTAEALNLRESYLTAIIENQPGLLWLKDANGCYLSANHAFARSCGRQTPEEVAGKTDMDVWPRELAERYQADDREVMTKRIPITLEEPIFDRGATKWFHTFKSPVFTPGGKVLGTCGFSFDVTERRQAEEERAKLEERLQRAEKMEALGTLAGGVAHDLNNLLGVVIGFSELLLDDLDESSPAKAEATEVLKAGQRAAAVVQDLLTLARRGVQGREVVSLNKVLLECRQSPEFAGLFSHSPHITVKTDFNTDVLSISGSPVHLRKSFLNLVTNAVEAMPSGGVLTLRTRNQYLDKPVSGYDEVKEGDYVVLSVSDTGEGISADDLKRIFEPFYTRKVMGRSGTGLGLAVVWGTVKDHKGYVNVESVEGEGTTFTLYFPVTRNDMAREQTALSHAEYMGKGESILIVDDIGEQRELAARMLSRLRYKVTAVSSGEEAVEYLKEEPFDLVVLDMILDPGIDGLDTYIRMLEVRPGQKAIIVSGFSETERVSRAQALGAGSYVKKPYVLETLGLAVRMELDRSVQSGSVMHAR